MMVTALVETAIALDDPRAAKLGRDAMSWLWQHHGRDDGTFWRASLYGRTSIRGALDDYAALAVHVSLSMTSPQINNGSIAQTP